MLSYRRVIDYASYSLVSLSLFFSDKAYLSSRYKTQYCDLPHVSDSGKHAFIYIKLPFLA